MDNIPKGFWWCAGIAVVLLSLGFGYAAFRSTEVNLEIFNTKIKLSSAIDAAISFEEDLKTKAIVLNKKSAELAAVRQELETGKEKIDIMLTSLNQNLATETEGTSSLKSKMVVELPFVPEIVAGDFQVSENKKDQLFKSIEQLNIPTSHEFK